MRYERKWFPNELHECKLFTIVRKGVDKLRIKC